MIRICVLTVCIFCIGYAGIAQNKGVKFEDSLSWQDIRNKAKLENKYIFLDCFTTWCAPCKRMNKEIFPVQQVGDYMNRHFINVKVQMDVTSGDNDYIKSWYADAKSIHKEYGVKAYPTFLFFNPEGNLVYQVSSTFSVPEHFIATSEMVIEPKKGLNALLKKYNDGSRDTTELKYLMVAAKNERKKELAIKVSEVYVEEVLRLHKRSKNKDIYKDLANVVEKVGNYDLAHKLANVYIDQLKDVFTKENISYLVRYTSAKKDRGFGIFVRHHEKVNKIMGEVSYNYAIDVAKSIIIKEDENITVLKDTNIIPDWNLISKNLGKKYPAVIAEKTVGFYKRIYYKQRQKWPEYIESLIQYVDSYPLSVTIDGYNNFAWEIFEHSQKKDQLMKALEWSKKTLIINGKEDHVNIDTYANLLYKLGMSDEAIRWEEKALGLAPENKGIYQRSLDKMKRGEKTWSN